MVASPGLIFGKGPGGVALAGNNPIKTASVSASSINAFCENLMLPDQLHIRFHVITASSSKMLVPVFPASKNPKKW